MLNKTKIFLAKNFLIDKHYKFSFMAQLFSLLLTLLIFFFIDSFFKSEVQKHIDLNINYFSYIFVSFIVFNYSGGGNLIYQKINFDITSGVFEFIVNKKNTITPYILSLWLYSLLLSTLESSVYFIIAHSLGLIKPNLNLISFFILILISSIVFSSIYIITSSFVILFKKGDIFSFLFSVFESIFAGVYFPISALGDFSQLSKLIPLTHSIKAAQKIFYQNAYFWELKEFYILLSFSLILCPLSVYIFKKSIYITRKWGNLNKY